MKTKKPIITYNGHKFYDLDEVDEYIISLNSIKEKKEFNRYIHQLIYENNELYEMAYSRQEYIRECTHMSDPIHFTIANIICLENVCPETINHWRSELLAFTKKIINTPTDKSVKRTKLLVECLISGYTEPYKNGYSYLDSYIYEVAMEDEIKKANRHNTTDTQKRIAKYIKYNILPNVEDYVNPNKDRIYTLFNALINAVDKSDITIFKDALDKFILY